MAMFALDGSCSCWFTALADPRRRRQRRSAARLAWRVAAGAMSLGAYWIAIWALHPGAAGDQVRPASARERAVPRLREADQRLAILDQRTGPRRPGAAIAAGRSSRSEAHADAGAGSRVLGGRRSASGWRSAISYARQRSSSVWSPAAASSQIGLTIRHGCALCRERWAAGPGNAISTSFAAAADSRRPE